MLKYKNIKKIVTVFFQLFILILIRSTYLGRVRVKLLSEPEFSGNIVIAANHAGSLDPFIIACFLPVKTVFRVFPYVAMTANVYYHRWWKPIAWLAGCYPAKSHKLAEPENSYGIGASVKFLEDGYTVVMFPEGKRTVKPIEAKPGISRILQQTNAPLVLCHIEWTGGQFLKKASFSVKAAPDNLDRGNPAAIMQAVYALPVDLKVEPLRENV